MTKTPYNYISSINYINNLTFDYIETYSFQRGIDFEDKCKLIKHEYEKLKVRKERRSNFTQIEEVRFIELNDLLGTTQYLINGNGQFHPSCKKLNSFKFNDPIVQKLANILRTPIKEIPQWLCAPTYRDAIVFYNKNNEIISTINICLKCQYMETEMLQHINGDFETYELLKRFFIEIGHDVEDQT